MAILCPLAEYDPLGPQTEPLMTAHDIICLHTMVGSLISTDNYFEQDGYGGVESHFGVGYNGQTKQWQDLARQADANLDGNPRLISIETADSGTGFPPWSGSNVPAWTEAQLAKLAELVAWLCNRFNIPCVLVPDSKPGRRGIGYHRQGIDPWRVAGGEVWSESDGKVCPGDRRVNQIPQVIARAKDILEGNIVTEAEMDQLLTKMWAKSVQVGNSLESFNLALGRTRNALENKPTTELSTEIAAVSTKIDGIATGEIDYDLLATKVVEKMVALTELGWRYIVPPA